MRATPRGSGTTVRRSPVTKILHSPGEWELVNSNNQFLVLGEADERGPLVICSVGGRTAAQQVSNARLIAAVPELWTAVLAAHELVTRALPQFDWGKSALDADAIRLLNETPLLINAAIKKVAK